MAVQILCEDVWSFKHDPLQDKSTDIRLIRLLPASNVCYPNTQQPIIQCEIFHVSQNDPQLPAYKALSYVWGSKQDAQPCIFVNNKSFPTQRNLFNALAQFQLELCNEESLTIWIDALCIEQSHSDEKSAQVTKMRDIYSAADEVILWLGQSTRKTASAVALMCSINHPKSDNVLDFRHGEVAVLPERHYSYGRSMLQNAFLGESEEFEGFMELVNKPYWHRMWVVQEYLAARRAIIRCGKERFLPIVFLRFCGLVVHVLDVPALSSFYNPQKHKPIISAIRRTEEILDSTLPMEVAIEQCHKDDSTYVFYNSLALNRSKQATDPRDKVFALVSTWNTYMKRKIQSQLYLVDA